MEELLQKATIEKIYVMLGGACNFKCRYCVQRNEKIVLPKEIDDSVIPFLTNAAKSSQRDGKKITINFFGGEPFLYYKNIQRIVDELEIGIARLKISTNGSFLSENNVNYCNEKQIQVMISHDGPNTRWLRGVDIFEDPEKRYLYCALRRRNIESVITAKSQDLYEMKEYWHSQIGMNDFASFSFLVTSPEMSMDLLDYDLKKWERTCDELGEAATSQFYGHIYGWESNWLRRLLKNYRKRLDGKAGLAYCPDQNGVQLPVSIDLSGRVFLCHNAARQYTNISKLNTLYPLEFKKKFDNTYHNSREFCKNCEWKLLCQTCPSIVSSNRQEKQCEFMKIFWRMLHDVYLDCLRNGNAVF